MTERHSFPEAPLCLTGQHVQLVPLSLSHEEGLREAVQDGEPWKLWYTAVPRPDEMRDEITRRLDLQKSGSMLPYTVLSLPERRIVGMTAFMSIDHTGPRVEIGSTWYAASVQRTALNTEAKMLLLSCAFETLDCLAVEFRTHFLNQRSRRAIERLGAKLDGILRSHRRLANGTVRDTCVYSVTAVEWPAVRTHLNWCLTEKYQTQK
ncbi:GNAT family protein [Acetobacter farinalis]|uniref:GNAT family protein n=1 Tax=Acetobacter farinalis TaxID=1260984 RepID=A0ABT3Q799_9PROT|nr:GNAT family protein [Acetobacter farinalis]MCX2561121.1 GNAT family protein [Acetobacter farinalis]NHO29630.1 GNAT family N-acetyltransferase [Acetobacter farinalis]